MVAAVVVEVDVVEVDVAGVDVVANVEVVLFNMPQFGVFHVFITV